MFDIPALKFGDQILLPLSVLKRSNLFREAAFGASCSVLMHRALGNGGVDALDCETKLLVSVVSASLGGLENSTVTGADLATDSAVASVALFVLSVALDCTLDVCHCV